METSRRSARVSAKRPEIKRAAAPRPATGAPEREDDERDPLAERDTVELEPELRRLVDLATD
jgi:hypothetical protein